MSVLDKSLFVHIQRTGGNAIRRALGMPQDPPDKHRTAVELRALYGSEIFASKFKFAFVRNPWARLVSWWSIIDALRPAFENGATMNNFQTMVLERATTFEEFLEKCDEPVHDYDGVKWIYRNQIDYISDESGVIVDFVGRHENIERDLNVVTMALSGQGCEIVRINASKHGHYTSYYTADMAARVAQRYARDIAVFGYEFGA